MILCANPRCRSLGRHHPDCEGECRGCLPRLAADGRNLCEVCTRRLAEDARTAGELHEVLAERLAEHGQGGPSVSGTKNHGLQMNEAAAQCRMDIRAVLVSWAKLIFEERGISSPPDVVPAVSAFVATHAVWLSAHPAASDAADEMGELAHGRPWRTAYPSGARSYPVGVCPHGDGTIHATVRDTDSLLPSVLTCDVDPEHAWTADTWRALGRKLHPGGFTHVSAHDVATTWRLPLGTVYRLAHDHAWPRLAGRRTAYLAVEVDATMAARALRQTLTTRGGEVA